MLPFTNPRIAAEFSDWPIGGDRRGQCRFTIEKHAKKGCRAVRVTTDKFGRWCKPKTSTYGGPAAIVDGADGRTYVLQLCSDGRAVRVIQSDLQHDAVLPGEVHGAYVSEKHPLYGELVRLVSQVAFLTYEATPKA